MPKYSIYFSDGKRQVVKASSSYEAMLNTDESPKHKIVGFHEGEQDRWNLSHYKIDPFCTIDGYLPFDDTLIALHTQTEKLMERGRQGGALLRTNIKSIRALTDLLEQYADQIDTYTKKAEEEYPHD